MMELVHCPASHLSQLLDVTRWTKCLDMALRYHLIQHLVFIDT